MDQPLGDDQCWALITGGDVIHDSCLGFVLVERVGGVDWSGMKSGDAEGDETRKIEKRKMGPERGARGGPSLELCATRGAA